MPKEADCAQPSNGIPTDGPKPGVTVVLIVEDGVPVEPPQIEKEQPARSG